MVLDRTHQVLLGAETVTLDGEALSTARIFHRLLLFHKPADTVCGAWGYPPEH